MTAQAPLTPHFAADARDLGRDEATAHNVAHTLRVERVLTLGALALCAVPVITNVAAAWWRKGFGSAIWTGLGTLILMGIVLAALLWALDWLLFRPWRAVGHGGCVKRMVADLPTLGVQPALLHTWKAPLPGVLALDTRNAALYVSGGQTDYRRLRLLPADIVAAKVERESEIHTTTKHGGSFGVMSASGLGYSFGSRSQSKSTVVERAFLEIHYQLPGQPAPEWLAVPFGENRREADSFAVAIARLGRPHT